MATSRMRHYNSPEEVAKREAAPVPEEAAQRRGFRHYNSPEERAKRGEADDLVVPPRPQRAALPVLAPPDWPPPGQPNDAPPAPAGPPAAPRRRGPPERPADLETRVLLLEQLLYSLVDSPADAAELRMNLSNMGAVVDSQRALGSRLQLLEKQVDVLADEFDQDDEQDDDDEPDDGQPEAPAEPAAAAPTAPAAKPEGEAT